MEKLSEKRICLLEKLFNLSTDESTIIKEITKNIDNLNAEKEQTKESKSNYEKTRKSLETELLTFSSQAKEFLSAFGKFNNSSFDKLNNIDIDLEIGTLVNKVKKSVPNYEKELNKEIKEQVNGISGCSKKIKELDNSIDKSTKDLAEARDLKDRLASLIEDILVNNNIESYTRGFINKLLVEVNAFDDDEIKELEYLILFPESGLKLYEESKKDQPVEEVTADEIPEEDFIELQKEVEEVKPLGPSLKETLDARKAEPVEPIVVGPTLKETLEKNKNKKDEALGPTLKETLDAKHALEESAEVEETSEEAKEYVYDNESTEASEEVEKVIGDIKNEDEFYQELENIGIDLNSLDIADKDKVVEALKNADTNTMKSNYELLKGLELEEQNIFAVDNNDYTYLADKELNNKVTTLRGKGIKDSAIQKYLAAFGLKMTSEELDNRIKILSDMKEELDDSKLNLLDCNLENYNNNIEKLLEAGIELDDKEKRNYMKVLERCQNIDELINVLSTYVINLSKRNGKFQLNILLSNSKDLLFNIDDLIERGLEDQISETPEIFDYNIDRVLDRITYCNNNSIPTYNEDDNSIYNYVYDAREFVSNYPDASINPLIERHESNEKIVDAFKDEYATKLVDTLNNYYENLKEYENVEVEENVDLYNKVLESAENDLDIQTVDKNTSKLNNIFLSKNKLERNIAIILNKYEDKEEIENNIKTTILVAALYNYRDNEIDNIVANLLNN